jgi:hypothetical protein
MGSSPSGISSGMMLLNSSNIGRIVLGTSCETEQGVLLVANAMMSQASLISSMNFDLVDRRTSLPSELVEFPTSL